MTATTPLYTQHCVQHAKFIDFHGWKMPLHYGSQLQEHHAVRTSVGVFDVSHMHTTDLLGQDSRAFLRKILTHDVDTLLHPGRALYSCLCLENGGIIDDLIVYYLAPEHYRLISNAATAQRVTTWLQDQAQAWQVQLNIRHDFGMIALQGPKASKTLSNILSSSEYKTISTLKPFECVQLEEAFFARTGYTGEDGFEIILPQESISIFWERLLAIGVQPCGLGARDTLRLEAGLLLSGQDMDETTTPLESNLGWTVRFSDRDFIGMKALLKQKEEGIQRRLVGLTLNENVIMRHAQAVYINKVPVGHITSGAYSPTLGYSIALARLPHQLHETVEFHARGQIYHCHIQKPRFFNRLS